MPPDGGAPQPTQPFCRPCLAGNLFYRLVLPCLSASLHRCLSLVNGTELVICCQVGLEASNELVQNRKQREARQQRRLNLFNTILQGMAAISIVTCCQVGLEAFNELVHDGEQLGAR